MEIYQSFLKKFFNSDEFKVYNLAGDASTRKYYRVIQNEKSWVLMSWDAFDPKNYPFLSVLNHFAKNGVNVPTVAAQSPKEGFVLLEDLGDLTLERKFWESQNQEHSLPFYEKSVDELIKIHFMATKDKGPCTAHDIKFDTDKFLWEMNYAKENLLVGICNVKFDAKNSNSIDKIFNDICSRLSVESKFIAHRDYHSRNVMIKLDSVHVIDFQDARLGPIQYDLVSLCRDSYVDLNPDMEKHLLNYYLQKASDYLPKDFSREQFDRIYELQTIQRCFKACGSFSSFYNQRQDSRYLKYISHTLKRVFKSLNQFSEYKDFTDILIDSGALERKYENL